MKRLGIFVSLIILSVSLFGGFYTPEKAHAAFENSQLQVLGVFSPNQVTFQSNYTPKQKEEYAADIVYLKNTLAQVGNDPKWSSWGDDDSTFKITALNIFITYLTDKQKVTSDPYLNNVIKDTLTLSLKLKDTIHPPVDTAAGGEADVSQPDRDALANAELKKAQQYGSVPPEATGVCDLSILPDGKKFSLGTCISEGVTWLIKNTLLEISGFLLWASANIFNTSIQVGILQFSKWAPDALYPIWTIIRQIISLIIVFIGLYLGFMYILGREDKFEKYIPWVIMFGLFVNFSYPLIRTAIDISNIISLNIYSSAIGSSALTSDSLSAGALIVSALGLNGLVVSATTEAGGSMVGAINSVPAALAAVAFVLYAAFIFIRVTILMIARTVSLVFLTIASPLLLVDAILPILGDKAQLLRKILFEQLAVGPVFMIMLALTLKFLEVFKTTGIASPPGVTALSGPLTTTIPVFFNMIMMLIMLHIMIKVTVSVSGSVGEWSTNAIGKVGGFGLGLAAGGVGLLARKGIGSMALKARESGWVQKNQESFIGRRAYDLSNSVANSTFDLRNSAVAGKMNKLGMGLGMGSKLGYEKESEERTKGIAARGARIKTRYERDVFEKDKTTGQTVLKHKAGDLDEEAEAAKRRYLQNNGGAMFLSKKEKDRLDDEMTKEYTNKNQAVKSQIQKESGEDLAKYASKKTKEEKETLVDGLKKELSDLKKTDPSGTGVKSMIIAKTLEDIDKKNAEEKEVFDKKIEDAIDIYKAKKGADQQKYFSSQTKEVRDAITNNLNTSVTQIIKGLDSAGLQQKMQNNPAGQSSPLPPTVTPTTNNAVDIDLPLDNIETVSFAQRAAQRRQMAQKTAQQRADAEATINASRTQPQPIETRPSPTPVNSPSVVVTPPVPSASNEASQDTHNQTESPEVASN